MMREQRIGAIDKGSIDAPMIGRGERCAYVLHRNELRLNRRPDSRRLQRLLRVDAGGNRIWVADGNAREAKEIVKRMERRAADHDKSIRQERPRIERTNALN